MDESTYDDEDGPVLARSFVVRALLEQPNLVANGRRFGRPRRGAPQWHGYVTDAETGDRLAWTRPQDVARFIERRLEQSGPGPAAVERLEPGAPGAPGVPGVPGEPGAPGVRLRGLAMAAPALTDVVTDMLTVLGQRLPPAAGAVPAPNVTLERVRERLVGLGNHTGAEPTGTLGVRTVRGGRLDARVRFQVWATTASDVDAAVQTLHTALLDDRDELKQAGFLQLAAADTTLAGEEASVPGWRKATSYDVLYEYRYVDSDDAQSLIVRIPVSTDPEESPSPVREVESITDEMVRWDQDGAPPLEVRGPGVVTRLSALVFVPGPALGGTVTFARSSGGGGPVAHLPTLAAFLDATSGEEPAETDADVQLDPAAAFAGLGAAGPGLTIGDWDADAVTDVYAGFDRRLDVPITLTGAADRFTVTYAPPAGPATGLDQTAVVYLRANPP
ncbi:collagen-like protein [Nocardioides sp. LMS-CY]|uniref:collagen-like triple helix repeat-containing protein n=1 Tax=Nocardioides sp. (strain LMS-CY) TaxID=2840457 RepID=UPI001C002616|nr:collagen-like protein [Nocardioides sp. LMS-CY]QWF20184.1 collagen-like protein [Nocardioides sp. LMS-CY]